MSIKIDTTNTDNLNQKIIDEKETRRRVINFAKDMGCEKEIIIIFNKYDKLIRNCKNEKEKNDISKLGIIEVYRLLGGGGELYVDGKLVVKDN